MRTNLLNQKLYLANLPTPIRYGEKISRKLGGAKVFIKRDDLTGIAFGGNKIRKLEYLLKDALEKKCDSVITVGGLQSNHCLQTATLARMLNLEPYLVLEGKKPQKFQGNLFLNSLLKANMRFFETKTLFEINDKMADLEKELLAEGKKPYSIPLGGSSTLGVLGYLNAVSEIKKQSELLGVHFDFIAVSATSCATFAGLILGASVFNYDTSIIGFNVGIDPNELLCQVTKLINDSIELFELSDLKIKTPVLYHDYIGEGYAVPSDGCKEAIEMLAMTEGIFLDPVYTGKTMAGVIDLIRKNSIQKDENILFIHTGGGPSLFAFNESF
jgi:L-cysteate sulfo-lyase